MSHAIVRRRLRDGVTEIVPATVSLTHGERYAALFAVVLVAMVLYVATLFPAWVFAAVFGCCAAAALAVVLQEAGVLQPPKAPVHVLTRWRPSGPGPLA